MAGIPNSPAVVFLEKDNSAYPPNVNSSIVGIVGFASRGPTDEPTLITSQENLLRVFGKPSEDIRGQGIEGALEILEATNQIQYVRAIPTDATYASATVQLGVCPAVQFAASSYGITRNLYLKVTAKDSDGVTVLDNKEFSITSGNIFSIGQASAIAKAIGDGSIEYDHVFVTSDDSSFTTGYLVGAYAGQFSQLNVSSYSNAAFTTPTSALRAVNLGLGEDGAGGLVSSVAVRGLSITTATLSYVVKSLYQGDGYNIGYDPANGQTIGINIEVSPAGGENSLITVNDDGVATENFEVSLLDNETFVETVINTSIDNAKSEFIQGELYRGATALGTITKLPSFLTKIDSLNALLTQDITTIDYAGTTEIDQSPRFVKFIDTNYDMSGGANGTESGNTALIGSAATKTGIHGLNDDLLGISLAVVPGINDDEVQNELITLAESTQNFLAVVSPPFGTSYNSAEEVTDWMNGKGAGRTAAINSSWAAVYWPWVQVFDTFAAKDRWYDPVIYAARQMVVTDAVAELWFAPAGFRRGRLTKPTAVEVSLNQGDRDVLYGSNINPIVNFSPEGITIFGQKTAQRLSTALDRVNVRRLMIYLRKVLLQAGRANLFEPNDEFTWDAVKQDATTVLADIQARRGITDFRVICDETVNTPLRVDRNELWCKILLKPTKTAEWIIFEVNLTNQSSKFSG
jgi:hypothetical protein